MIVSGKKAPNWVGKVRAAYGNSAKLVTASGRSLGEQLQQEGDTLALHVVIRKLQSDTYKPFVFNFVRTAIVDNTEVMAALME